MSSPYHQNGTGVCTSPRTASLEAVPPEQRSPAGIKHVPISTWLLALGLAEYEKLFSRFSGVEDLLSLSEADIRDLGVRNGAHRARMVSTLVIFKEKVHSRKMNKASTRADNSPTPASDTPPSQVNHPDYAAVSVPSSQVSAAKVAQVLLGVANNREHPSMKDLSQFGWYHGNIPRQKAEKLLTRDGDFLVRDSLSQPGDFVLTVFWKGIPLHFVLNKHISEAVGSQPVVEYQFEDVRFSQPSELILHYMKQQEPITEMSGAVISQPILRTVPLEFYDAKTQEGQSPRSSPWASPRASPQGSPHIQQKLSHARRAGSQPLLLLDDGDSYLEAPQQTAHKTSMSSAQPATSTPSVNLTSGSPSTQCHSTSLQHVGSSPRLQHKLAIHHRTGSEPVICPSPQAAPRCISSQSHLADSDSNLSRNPPPKPSRIPTVRKRPGDQRPVVAIRNKDLYDDDGRDYSDYDQIKSWPAHLEHSEKDSDHQSILRNSARSTFAYDIPKNQNRNALVVYDVPKALSGTVISPTREDPTTVIIAPFTMPDPKPVSSFDLAVYDSELLTPNNKPLEPSAMTTIKALLLDSNPKVMAQHTTSIDLELLKVIGMHDLGLGAYSGLELMTLPHGHVLRQDVIERHSCLSLFVALTVLMCSKCSDRSLMIHQWIQTAIELRGKLGNLYGFSAVMGGLMSPQIKRLRNTWLALRQEYSESAFMFEHRLTGLLSTLDNASAMLPLQDITIPYIMPLVELLEQDITDLEALISTEKQDGCELDVVLAHLDTARIVTQQCGLYRVTAENVMRDFRRRRDLLDLFRTEMHLKLLWGARGATVARADRFSKFPAVLDLLSERVEPSEPAQGETSV